MGNFYWKSINWSNLHSKPMFDISLTDRIFAHQNRWLDRISLKIDHWSNFIENRWLVAILFKTDGCLFDVWHLTQNLWLIEFSLKIDGSNQIYDWLNIEYLCRSFIQKQFNCSNCHSKSMIGWILLKIDNWSKLNSKSLQF